MNDAARAEYEALRTGAGVRRLDDWAAITIGGKHRTRWLHNMVTQDIKGLQPGDGGYATIVDYHGRVQSDLYVYNDADGEQYVLTLPAGRTDAMLELLKKYVVAERIVFTDRRATWAVLTVQGPNASALLGDPAGELSTASLGGHAVRLARCSRTGEPGWDVLVERDAADAVHAALVGAGATPYGPEAAEIARVEAAIPRYGSDVDDELLPQHAGLRDAVHWSKGCYIGHEPVLMLEERGRTNRELRQLRLASSVPAGAELRATAGGKACGKVTSVAAMPDGTVLALGLVKRRFMAPGTELVAGPEGVEAVVTDRPIRAHAAGRKNLGK